MTPEVVIGALVVLVVGWALYAYNRLVKLRNRVASTRSDVDVQLTRRLDLIPNLVEVVKAYAAHERDVLEAVTEARAHAMAASDTAEEAAAADEMDAATTRLAAVAEAYPDLKADERFRALSDELVATEDKIAFSRTLLNDVTTAYRDATQRFPTMLIARAAGFHPPPLFAAEADQRSAPSVGEG